jgi:site-specific recombinase XerD
MRRQLGNSFRKATKADIRALLEWTNEQEYKPATHEKFRQVLKLFYKTVYEKGRTCLVYLPL